MVSLECKLKKKIEEFEELNLNLNNIKNELLE